MEEVTKYPVQSKGAHLIEEERMRQIQVEGWHHAHDAEHANFELTRAAIAYAGINIPGAGGFLSMVWPWEPAWFKQADDPIRNLVKAGALIAAEIDRLCCQPPVKTPAEQTHDLVEEIDAVERQQEKDEQAAED